jgi:hypothetical protein
VRRYPWTARASTRLSFTKNTIGSAKLFAHSFGIFGSKLGLVGFTFTVAVFSFERLGFINLFAHV